MNKTCRTCGISRLLDEFYANKNTKDGLDSSCKRCRSKAHSLWALKNPKKNAAIVKRWRERHPELNRSRVKSWASIHGSQWQKERYRKNPELFKARSRFYRKKNHQSVVDSIKRWRRANPDKVRAMAFRRKSLTLGAKGVCSESSLKNRVDMFGSKCWLCGNQYEAIDHVKPLTKGGSNWPSNLRPICKSCNSTKRNKWPLVGFQLPFTELKKGRRMRFSSLGVSTAS